MTSNNPEGLICQKTQPNQTQEIFWDNNEKSVKKTCLKFLMKQGEKKNF